MIGRGKMLRISLTIPEQIPRRVGIMSPLGARFQRSLCFSGSKPGAVCLTTRSFLQRSVAIFFYFFLDALRIFGTGDAGVVGINWCDSFHKQIPLLYMRFFTVCILLRYVFYKGMCMYIV
jgi:hypothetical protein